MMIMHVMDRLKRSVGVSTLLLIILGSLWAATPVISSFTLQGRMPEDQYFRVDISSEAENVDLTQARGRDISIGSYRLFSNVGKASFRIIVRAGEDGQDSTFKLALAPGTPHAPNLETEIQFSVGLSATNEALLTINEDAGMVSKSVGSRSRSSGGIGVQESGEIFARIPNFDPELYATGNYSAAIQFSVTTD